jgi:SAM-dependent methyltransferase
MTVHPYRNFEHTGWQRAATQYAETFEAATRLFAPSLLDAAGLGAGAELLDVACGTGFVTEVAAARGAAAVGVDFSPNMIAEATRRRPTLSFVVADAEALPFGEGSFDAVVINFGVHHFPFPLRALADAHRVLKPGGRLAFTVWASPEESVLHRAALEAVRAAGDVEASLPAPPHGSVNEISTCTGLLAQSGFDIVPPWPRIASAVLWLRSVQHLVHMLRNGTVRLSALLGSQPPERTSAILTGLESAVAKYEEDGRLRIPVAAILAVGVKPGAMD